MLITACGWMLTHDKTHEYMYLSEARMLTLTPHSVTQERRVGHVIFLYLTNLCIFVPENVLQNAFGSSRVQLALCAVRTYLKDFSVCL